MNEAKINELLKLKAECLEKKERYLKALDECSKIAESLRDYNRELNVASDDLYSSFNINGKGIDNGRLVEVADDYADISNDFSGKVTEGIEIELKNIETEINAYDEEINKLRNLSR